MTTALVYKNIMSFIRDFVVVVCICVCVTETDRQIDWESDCYDWYHVAIHIQSLVSSSSFTRASSSTRWLPASWTIAQNDWPTNPIECWLWLNYGVKTPVVIDFSNVYTFFLPVPSTWFTHAIHMEFPLSFVYLKTQVRILFWNPWLVWPLKGQYVTISSFGLLVNIWGSVCIPKSQRILLILVCAYTMYALHPVFGTILNRSFFNTVVPKLVLLLC